MALGSGRESRVQAILLTRLGTERHTALREAWSIFCSTRLIIAALGVLAAQVAGKSISGSRFKLDVPGLTHPFVGPFGALFS
ncbi:MAG: hypothetical protein NVS2B6_14590 [Thermoleophilaceae bacterium]